jgi:outer membrane protein assembly factor BamB
MNRKYLVISGVLVGLLTVVASAQEWPQWRGPNRDATVVGFTPPAVWPEKLTSKWSVDIGLGYATPLVVGNRIFVFSRQGESEVMSALEADLGKVLWRTAYPVSFEMAKAAAPHGPGPKSTPALAGGKLYSIGMTGIVTAFDAATGKQLWQKPAPGVMTTWTSHSFSPLVDRGNVIFHVGGHDKGALTAFDATTGEVKWSWAGDGPGYGSPMIADLGGLRQIVTMTQKKVIGVDLATGALLWEHPYTTQYDQNAVTPIVYGQTLIVSGYQKPVVALSIHRKGNAWTAETAWENPGVTLYMSDAVVIRDTLFGFSQRQSGQFFALDPRSGKTLWVGEPRQATNAAIVKTGDLWMALKDDGELIVAKNNPATFEVLRRYRVAESATWAPPVVSERGILIKDTSTLTLWTFK